MKKRLMLALMLLLCAALLAACSGDGKRYDVLTSQNSGNQQTQQSMGNQSAGQTDDEGYDPLAEEDDYDDWTVELPTQAPVTSTPAPTVRSEYAGATPVVIDPIDKPTPSPVPKLSVTYTVYDAAKLGLAFEGPAGWSKNDSADDSFIIWNPNSNINYQAALTLTAQKVSADYSTSNLESVVESMLDSIGSSAWEDYEPSRTASRDLLGKSGVYANYEGVLADGVEVAGRVHAVCVNKVLYTLHLTAPAGQWEDYKTLVYDHLRDTITIVK